jgi:hypothetical protein
MPSSAAAAVASAAGASTFTAASTPSQRNELPEPRLEPAAWFHGGDRLRHAAPSSTSLSYGPAKSALAPVRDEADWGRMVLSLQF